VHLFFKSDQTGIQTPSEFCTSKNIPNPSHVERLSEIGLDVPQSLIETDEENTPTHLGITSQIDSDASSSMGYDLNKTAEENEEIFKRRRS